MDMVIYHADCNDGFCAAWLARKAFPDAEFVPAHYGQDPPDVSGRDVLIADFSWPREQMIAMEECSNSLVCLDHHKTAQADLEGLGWCAFDMESSGARLTWEFLHSNGMLPADWVARWGYSSGVAPWLVDYTEDRDLWRWALTNSHEVNAALSSYSRDFAVWSMLHRRQPHELAIEGAAILRYQDTVVEQHVRNAIEIEIAGYKVPAVNATVLLSEIAGKLAESAPFGVAYFDRKDGKRQFSLRSRGEGGIDVSEVARRFGGGGHRNAAGFEAIPGESLA